MKAIMSEDIYEATKDPKQRKELRKAIADLVSKPGNKEDSTITVGGKNYKISTPESRR